MLNTHRMSASVSVTSMGSVEGQAMYLPSSWYPWLPLAMPCTSRHMTSQRFVTM